MRQASILSTIYIFTKIRGAIVALKPIWHQHHPSVYSSIRFDFVCVCFCMNAIGTGSRLCLCLFLYSFCLRRIYPIEIGWKLCNKRILFHHTARKFIVFGVKINVFVVNLYDERCHYEWFTPYNFVPHNGIRIPRGFFPSNTIIVISYYWFGCKCVIACIGCAISYPHFMEDEQKRQTHIKCKFY